MQIDTIVIPDNRLHWSNKLQRSPLVQKTEHMTNGALVTERSTKLAGIHMVLESGESGFTRDILEQLVQHAIDTPAEFTITLTDATQHTVIWDIQDDGSHITGTPLFRHDGEPSTQLFNNIKLRFLTYVA